MKSIAMRLCTAWVLTLLVMLALAEIASKSTAGTNAALDALFFAGVPYLIILTRWVIKG